jgi:hypothetical protein
MKDWHKEGLEKHMQELESKYDDKFNWFPLRTVRKNITDRGGKKKWKQSRNHVKRDLLR